MSEPLDEQYLTWLYASVGSIEVTNPSRTYWCLLRQLFTKEFVWFVPNDGNRSEDGRDLRYEFIQQEDIRRIDPNWMHIECSMLELLIVLSRMLSFEAEGEPRAWFWRLISNINLDKYTDAFYEKKPRAENSVNDILERLMQRRYNSDGTGGGLFPLEHPTADQRLVELWYQMAAYIIELDDY